MNTLINIIDVMLHKVGYNTENFKRTHYKRAEVCARELATRKEILKYRSQCIVSIDGNIYDFTGEYDMFLKEGKSPWEAWHETMVEFAWK